MTPLPVRLRFAALALVAVAAPAGRAADKVDFARDVLPVLSENCFACHGPDAAARKADLRLDLRDAAVKSGAITPGKPDESELVARLLLPDADKKHMPPVKSLKKVTDAQKDVLKRWVAAGAEYTRHWSFVAPTRPTPPAVFDKAWVRNPVDAFVLEKVEKAGLKPAPEADRRTLARRLSLDLIGLPPKPEEVEAFVKDEAKDAYERYVDNLLASPHWGEHRGRYWLDYARYADTHGIHFDNYRENWAYREWVVKAINDNMKFDEFTVEQLAGDLLKTPTLDQLVATGFNRCNITTNEGGAIADEYLVLYNRDRTETVNQVWMGLTAGCAVCHDHKFDPISQRDFYAMAAFFNNTTQGAMDGNIPNTPPVITVPKAQDRAKFEMIAKEIVELKAKLDARKKEARADFDKWLASVQPDATIPTVSAEGLVFHAPLTEGKDKSVKFVVNGKEQTATLADGFDWSVKHGGRGAFTIRTGASLEAAEGGDFEKDKPFSVSAWVSPATPGATGAIVARMDSPSKFRGWDLWMQAGMVGMHVINAWPDDALKVVAKKALEPGKWHHVAATYDGSGKAAGVKIYVNGELQQTTVEADKLKSTIKTTVPLKVGQRNTTERLLGAAVEDLRLYARALTAAEAKQLGQGQRLAELVAKPADKRTPAEKDELFAWWLDGHDKPSKDLSDKHAAAVKEEAAIRRGGPPRWCRSSGRARRRPTCCSAATTTRNAT